MKAAVLKEHFLAHPVYIYIYMYVHSKVPQLYMYTVKYRSSICTLYSTAAVLYPLWWEEGEYKLSALLKYTRTGSTPCYP